MADLSAPEGFELTYAQRPELPPLSGEDHFVAIFTKEGVRRPDRPWVEIKAYLYGSETDAKSVLMDPEFVASGWSTPGVDVVIGDELLTNRPSPTTYGLVFQRSNFVVFGWAHEAFVGEAPPESLEAQVYDLLKQVDSRIIAMLG